MNAFLETLRDRLESESVAWVNAQMFGLNWIVRYDADGETDGYRSSSMSASPLLAWKMERVFEMTWGFRPDAFPIPPRRPAYRRACPPA